MIKKFSSFIIMILLVGALGYWMLSEKDVFQTLPWAKSMPFKNVSNVQMAPNNSYYIVDQSLQRLTNMNKDGVYQFHIHVNKHHNRDSLYLIKDFAVDKDGYIYVLALVMDKQGIFLEAEEIIQYTPHGQFNQTIYKVSYKLEERVTRPGRLHELKEQDGYLYFYSFSEEDLVEEQDMILHRLHVGSRATEQVLQITLPEETFIAALEGIELGSIYYTTKRGEIYQIDITGKSNLLYSTSTSGLEESYPVRITNDRQQNIYFVDIGREEINKLESGDGSETLSNVLNNSQLKAQGYPLLLKSADSIQANQDGSIILGVQHSVVHFNPLDGQLYDVFNGATYKVKDIIYRLFFWTLAVISVALLIYVLKLLFFDIMRQSPSLVLKQIIIFIPVIVISMALIAAVVYSHFLQELDEEIKGMLKLLAHAGAEIVDTERMERITKPEHFMNEDYRYINDRNHNMLRGNPELDADALYSAIYSVNDNKQVRILMLYNTSNGTQYPTDYLTPEYDMVIQEGRIVTKESQEVTGEWLYALGPIYNVQGKLIGMQEVGMTLHNYNEAKKAIFGNVVRAILILIPASSVVFLIMTYLLLSSIRKLRSSVLEIADGNLDTKVEIRTKDEVGELGKQFNNMAEQLDRYVQEMKEINASYFRFVPEQFLEYLGKKRILDVRLGDQIEEEMVILVSNIRSFHSITKRMTPKESFAYINSFYELIGPIIRRNEGMINTYLSAGVMALFSKQPEQAICNAIEMKKTLAQIALDAEKTAVFSGVSYLNIGIGIHKGPLMLGIVGEQERMEGNVISDDVNISLLLEKHTEAVGASILISSAVFEAVPSMNQFDYRYLGLVQLPEMGEPIELYDVFEGDSETVRRNKALTKELFEQGIAYYQAGRFFDARTAFVDVIKRNDQDQAAKLYFSLCDEYFQKGTGAEWSGTLELHRAGGDLRQTFHKDVIS